MEQPSKQLSTDEIRALADILLGAAYADGVFVGLEALAIHKILRDRLETTVLPDDLEDHLREFDPQTFDLENACAQLNLSTREQRRSLLALVAAVTEADHVFHLDEDAYIKRLARIIGADPGEFADLTVDVISVTSLAKPPPVPGD